MTRSGKIKDHSHIYNMDSPLPSRSKTGEDSPAQSKLRLLFEEICVQYNKPLDVYGDNVQADKLCVEHLISPGGGTTRPRECESTTGQCPW